MIKLEQISETFGDCTALYSVEMTKPYTVGEFIKEVLKRKEWGYIETDDGDKCEYKQTKIISNDIPEEAMNKTVIKARAHGGWSRMDYVLDI